MSDRGEDYVASTAKCDTKYVSVGFPFVFEGYASPGRLSQRKQLVPMQVGTLEGVPWTIELDGFSGF